MAEIPSGPGKGMSLYHNRLGFQGAPDRPLNQVPRPKPQAPSF